MKKNVLVFLRDPATGRLLLSRRADELAGKFNGIAGSMAKSETAEEAGARKVFEETGLVVPKELFKFVTYVGSDLVVLTATIPLRGAVGTVEQLLEFAHNSNWAREPVVENLKWLIPLALRPDLEVPVANNLP